MRKQIRIFIVLIVMCVCITPIFAKPSISHNGTIDINEILIDGKKVDTHQIIAVFRNDMVATVKEQEVVETIQQINTTPEKLMEILKSSNVEVQGLNGLEFEVLTQLQDLSLINKQTGEIIKDAKNVTITWEVPNLVKGLGDIKVLHYSTVRDVWEILTPTNIDFNTNSITQYFQDLSPVAVIYVPAKTDITPQIATSDTSMIIPIASVCLISSILIIVFVKKKNKK